MTSRFKSASAYRKFVEHVVRSARYVRDAETEEFLTTLLAEGRERRVQRAEGSIFWRAQLGNGWEPLYDGGEYIDDMPCPLPAERMKPLPDRAREGRANPKGIPYLYVATRNRYR